MGQRTRLVAPITAAVWAGVLGVVFIAAPATAATFTFPTIVGPTSVTADTGFSVPLTGAPAATYNRYTLSIDWTAVSGGPFSQEAVFRFYSDALGMDTGFEPGQFFYGFNAIDPVTMTVSGVFTTPYVTDGTSPFFLLGSQTFSPSEANWSNITVTLDTEFLPPATPLTGAAGTVTGATTAANPVAWYSFVYDGSSDFIFDTIGSELLGNNTVIAIFSSSGALLASNDDLNTLTGDSRISNDATLPGGLLLDPLTPDTYYLAVATFGTIFDDGFLWANRDPTAFGNFVVNYEIIPEPAGLTAAGLALVVGLAVGIRRGRRQVPVSV